MLFMLDKYSADTEKDTALCRAESSANAPKVPPSDSGCLRYEGVKRLSTLIFLWKGFNWLLKFILTQSVEIFTFWWDFRLLAGEQRSRSKDLMKPADQSVGECSCLVCLAMFSPHFNFIKILWIFDKNSS